GVPLTAQAMRPLARVTYAARRVARGDLSQRVGLQQTDDEIGELAYTFDEMVERIQETFAAQQASEDRMRLFIADASHELRTPLTAIRGYTDVLLRGAKDDPETVERVLRATRREAERMTRLVNDLLTLARLDTNRPLDMQSVDVIALVGEAVDQARILAGEREVAMRTDGGGRLMVTLDADRIKQVLLILLDNALKYGRQTPDGWVRVYVARTNLGALITIADNGQGIAPEDLPYIFERFYRAERAARRRRMTGSQVAARPESPAPTGAQRNGDGVNSSPGGSGLGLAIARAIVEAHGGKLSVQSRLGAGTTFTLALPLTPPPRRGASAPALSHP
ncbi:MAG TPA: HAMP domain-containing sensor histidine kinase, partial [Ktedonobacterales bacterium]|nr:HAMP domain-containing sensor histidine kinase [Ktedonobacterales bacterium]